MEKMAAETLLTASVQVLLDKLLSYTAETVLSKLFGDHQYWKILKGWKSELKSIEAVLADADQRQSSSKAVREWLEQLRDVAFDMEDVLEDFDIQVLAHEINMANASGVFGRFKKLAKRHKKIMPKNPGKIEDITERLKIIQDRMQTMGLSVLSNMQHHTPPPEALRRDRESGSLPSKVFGRDDEKQQIVNELLKDDESDEKNYVLIPIVGMGGIGKTTLAQSVYHDEQLEGHFHLKAWVCVSDVFDVTRITTTICREGGTIVDFNDLNEAQKQLKKVLTGKKFLFVLDDIWTHKYDDWDKLQRPFQYAAKGSRVIMTTRDEKIARMMSTDTRHNINLKGLKNDHCWLVFQHCTNNDSDLAKWHDDIIEKCKGLPLVAKVLGGLLKNTVDKERQVILQRTPWKEENDVLPALRLSYHYLSSDLKRMFAYCSVLPKDYQFKKSEIVLLWMAQGFLPEDEHMEDLGNYYFDVLRSRSLFEQSPNSEESLSSEDVFIMHDLIHDLAQWAAGGNCYVMGTKTRVDWQRIRHVYFNGDYSATLESQLPMASQLRTFYCEEYMRVDNLNFIEGFHYIRSLRLSCYKIEVLPECIGKLQHLRFLDLICESIKELPTSIGNLWYLQTLSLDGCIELEKLPHIGDLKHLRFINLNNAEHIKELPESISNLWNLQTLCLKYCSQLEMVPNVSSLDKLRHLEIKETSLKEMPIGLEKVTNLQSLDKFILGHESGARITELKEWNDLEGEIKICGLENVSTVEDAREAQLHKKCKLDKLCLEWGTGRDDVDDDTKRDVLQQLKPHSSIKECELKGYGGLAFPGWLGDPCFNNMVNITLSNCEKCECLPPLGQLPHLEFLLIEGMDGIVEVGPEFYGCSNPFPTLKSLHFTRMKSWERWLIVDNEANNPFSCLESLKISDCKELSASIPLQMLPSLKMLQVWECKIQLITPSPCELPHLTTLYLTSCPSLISFPDGLLLPALQTLEISRCEYISELNIDGVHSLLSSLSQLGIRLCPNLKSISCSTLHNLTTLNIWKCLDLESFEVDALSPQLHSLHIENCPKLQLNQTIEAWELHSLRSLRIENVDTIEDLSLPSSIPIVSLSRNQNLKSLSIVGDISNFINIHVDHCRKLESLVANFTSPKLKFKIDGCYLMYRRLKYDPNGRIFMHNLSWSLR